MVERSRTYKTDDGSEYLIRVMPGSIVDGNQSWLSSVNGMDDEGLNITFTGHSTALSALQEALDHIGYVDREAETPPNSTTAFYNDGRGIVRIVTRSQIVGGVRRHRATVTRQGSVLLVSKVYNNAVDAFDEAMQWILTDQSPSRQFAITRTTSDPSQVNQIVLDRDEDTSRVKYKVVGPGGEDLHQSQWFDSTMEAVIAATHWIAINLA